MKRKINIALSIIWLSLVYGLFFFMRSQLKFPTLDLYNGGWFVIGLMTVSFWGLVFAFVSTEKRKRLRIFSSIFIIIGIAASLWHTAETTLLFYVTEPGIYPLYSETTNPDDYLIFDEQFEGNYEYLTEMMPKQISAEAENITYKYYYNGFRSGRFEASWSLPEAEYKKVKNNTLKKDGQITYAENVTIFATNWNITEIPAFWTSFIAEFNDETKTVSYSAGQIYCD